MLASSGLCLRKFYGDHRGTEKVEEVVLLVFRGRQSLV